MSRPDATIDPNAAPSSSRAPRGARREHFVSFDRGVRCTGWLQRPDRFRALEADLGHAPRIARGGGCSYAAASFGRDVVTQHLGAFDRLLAFEDGTLRVEAGLSLARLLDWTLPRGLYIPALPGYPWITVGGCIAADSHGKNPARDGTFCDWVEAVTLFHPHTGYRTLSRTEHAALFEATCGGFGLTGIIVDATLRLAPLPSTQVTLTATPIESLLDGHERLHAVAAGSIAYSWHEGTTSAQRFGRGLLFQSSWGEGSPVATRPDHRPTRATPSFAPLNLWSPRVVACANAIYRTRTPGARTQPILDALFPFARQPAYHWMFGPRGFVEVQVLVPAAAAASFFAAVETLVRALGCNVTLVSLKTFRGRQRSLSLSGQGTLLALDMVRDEGSARFLAAFDDLCTSSAVQPSVSKDSRLPAGIAARLVPHYDGFRRRLHEADPARLFRSELSERLAL
jgi:decaprenylphospho-beta-D-ribofuranose 2-oxidase